jgi:hypothetical protein
MVDGTLPLENFRYYVVQDALYLKDFAASLRILAEGDGVPDWDSDRLRAFSKGAEEAELSLHNGFFRQWGIEPTGPDGDGAPQQMPNTVLYTSYMLRVVATRPRAEGLAVLLPCFWVYMHVGRCMLDLRSKLGDRYGAVWRNGRRADPPLMMRMLTSIFFRAAFRSAASRDHPSTMLGSTCTAEKSSRRRSRTTSGWSTRRAKQPTTIPCSG